MEEILVNLGCGLHAPAGWVNIDRSPTMILDRVKPLKSALHKVGLLSEAHMATWPENIVRHDVSKGLDFPDHSVAAIYSSHMLEHLYLNDAKALLRECRRVLRGDGVLRLALPDTKVLAERLLAAEQDDPSGNAALRYNEALCAYPFERPRGIRRPAAAIAASYHRWQPTPSLIRLLLTEAGFTEVTDGAYLEGEFPGLADVEYQPESLFVEAR